MTSQFKTFFLLALLSGIILVLGSAMGGRGGLVVAAVMALAMNLGSYWFSDSIVLRMYRAQPVQKSDNPALYAMVEELAAAAKIPTPRLYRIPEQAPNAFATGRNPEHGVVAVTDGILRILSHDELRGVIAHEIGHIANRDILVQTVAGVLATVVVYLAHMAQWAAIFGGRRDGEGGGNAFSAILLAILAPIAASLIQFAISRSREYGADDAGARYSASPRSLASALRKLESYNKQIPMQTESPATAHMFIVTPFAGGGMARLLSTHPPIAERVARLEAMN